MELADAATVSDLKHKLQEETHVNPKRQKLLGLKRKDGKPAGDDDVLLELGLKPGTKVILMGCVARSCRRAAHTHHCLGGRVAPVPWLQGCTQPGPNRVDGQTSESGNSCRHCIPWRQGHKPDIERILPMHIPMHTHRTLPHTVLEQESRR